MTKDLAMTLWKYYLINSNFESFKIVINYLEDDLLINWDRELALPELGRLVVQVDFDFDLYN